MFQELLIVLILFFLIFFGYIKVYHRFWYLQPVFHFYKIWNFFLPTSVIANDPIESTFNNQENILTTTFGKASQCILEETIWLLQRHFLRDKNNEYIPDLSNNFLPFFTDKCFISVYYNERILKETKTAICKKDKSQIIGVITSFPLTMILFSEKYVIHYVDYLCVHRNFRKRSIAEQLIQTHEYNQRLEEPNIKISLFKREGTLNFIVPLCVYKTYFRKVFKNNNNNNFDFIIEEPSFREIIDFVNRHNKKFKCFIQFPWASISKLIETKNIFFVSVKHHAMYFFKDSCTTYSKDKTKMLVCIGSILLEEEFDKGEFDKEEFDKEDFKTGFDKAVELINKKNKNIFSAVIIESVAHNNYLLSVEDVFFTNMAYFFYNFTQTTISPSQFLFIG